MGKIRHYSPEERPTPCPLSDRDCTTQNMDLPYRINLLILEMLTLWILHTQADSAECPTRRQITNSRLPRPDRRTSKRLLSRALKRIPSPPHTGLLLKNRPPKPLLGSGNAVSGLKRRKRTLTQRRMRRIQVPRKAARPRPPMNRFKTKSILEGVLPREGRSERVAPRRWLHLQEGDLRHSQESRRSARRHAGRWRSPTRRRSERGGAHPARPNGDQRWRRHMGSSFLLFNLTNRTADSAITEAHHVESADWSPPETSSGGAFSLPSTWSSLLP